MYQEAQPPAHLKRYIDLFWCGEVEANNNLLSAHHAIASTKLEMQFHYAGRYVTKNSDGRDEQVFKAGFFGQTNSYKHYLSVTKRTGIFSVRFHPLALAMLLNIPADKLTNESYDLHTILGKESVQLEEQIFEAGSFEERVLLVTTFLEKRIRDTPLKYQHFEKVLDHIHLRQGQIPAGELNAQVFLSQRQFERSFKELTGFSAKNYLRIIRFERTVEAIARSGSARFSDIALDYGYYDQAHFNRHFREYTGTTPTAYFNYLSQDL